MMKIWSVAGCEPTFCFEMLYQLVAMDVVSGYPLHDSCQRMCVLHTYSARHHLGMLGSITYKLLTLLM
ncbi:Uncharacterized protein TCM_011220 [Theobroma cacao]|uniref:Uncharacterized protein n=1 Tax=Theobroma cacao TaxID=3641 RepID=A0A061EG69_THECC|nr:Uncharacterized protein TCM_011220 [Theobroma cacao]